MSIDCSYYPNYYSIEDILASQQKLPCTFTINVPKLGCLNPSAETEHLESGTKLELPLWLVENIALSRKGSLAVADIPRIYKEKYREILKADATAVDLNKLCNHFYEFGKYVSRFEDQSEVLGILVETFKARFRQLMDISQNSGADPSLINKFEVLERSIYQAAYKSYQQLETWLVQTEAPMQAAEMVVNHKKRKRIALDVD